MQTLPAPIVLFVYNRPEHTKQTLEALQKNTLASESILFIYADGPKETATQEQLQKISDVRSLVRSQQWCKEVHIVEREKNRGLAPSIIEGVTEIVNRFGRIIVLEDDLVTSPYFLQYMNDALDAYENENEVISIHGYVYPIKKKLPYYFFIRGADCWGWATWKRGWSLFNPNSTYLLEEIKKQKLENQFNFNNTYDYTGMLQQQIDGKVSSWAVRWLASAYLAHKLTLYPAVSFVQNTGLDGSGTHCGNSEQNNILCFSNEYFFSKIPIIESKKARKAFENYFKPKQTINNMLKNCFVRLIKSCKKLFLNLTPPIFIKFYKKMLKPTKSQAVIYGWFAGYNSWQEAQKECTGYDSEIIINKVKASVLKVKNGEAVYERDSFIFDEIQYSWTLLSALYKTALTNKGLLSVLDFGGSLGSSYFQNKKELSCVKQLEWSVVEQQNFVEIGKKEIQDDILKFYYTIEECLQERNPNILLLSSVLQYIEKPYELIEKLLQHNFEYIFIDRTSFINSAEDIITVQRVPPEIYSASYPCWFFYEQKFINVFLQKYNLLYAFDALDKPNLPNTYHKGMCFKLK